MAVVAFQICNTYSTALKYGIHMNEWLPVPRTSLYNGGASSGSEAPRSKRSRQSTFPVHVLKLVKQGRVYSVTGLLHLTSVRHFSIHECRDGVTQYLDLVQSTKNADASTYVVWTVEQCMPIIDGPLILSSSDLAGSLASGISSSHLSATGYANIMDKRISIFGNHMLLSDVFNRCPKPRTIRITDFVSESLALGSLTVLVTPKGYAYHCGIPTCEISDALAASDSNATIDSTAGDDDVSDNGSNDSESDGGHKQNSYDFQSVICAMRLGSLLRNAATIKEAMKAALGLAAAESPGCSEDPLCLRY